MTSAARRRESQGPDEVLTQLWESIYDPGTQQAIRNLPVQSNWCCLDVGAGAGSMSYWLANVVDQGTVLAVDVDTRQFDVSRSPNLTVREADIHELEFEPHSFDLILARAVFGYLRRPEEALQRALRWLAPGGWIVVEDFYYLPTEHVPSDHARAVTNAYLHQLRSTDADMHWGRRLPSTLAKAGLHSVDLRVTPLGPGQHALGDELIRTRMRLQGPDLVRRGAVSAADLDSFVAGLGDPRSRDVATLLFSVWGQQPATR
ncbi:class I SAM-dependent methyltransferase [Amycolatopsis orientalis]|uniref:class I SAM-dependent methyltransferase n=1 Tax=Amycolatopsis orientalis TaxID=31958 RepID=UPI000697DC23|nr:class I SAM-dependent methyltransferase [Amycolatopsis orientalis]